MTGFLGGGRRGRVRCIRWEKAAIIGDPVANRLDPESLAPPSSRLSSVVFGLLALSGGSRATIILPVSNCFPSVPPFLVAFLRCCRRDLLSPKRSHLFLSSFSPLKKRRENKQTNKPKQSTKQWVELEHNSNTC